MPDEETLPEEDSSNADGPEGEPSDETTAAEETIALEDYKNLQAHDTQVAQEAAQFREAFSQLADPEARDEAIALLQQIAPHLLEDAEEEDDLDEYVDPTEAQVAALAERQERIEQYFAEQGQAAEDEEWQQAETQFEAGKIAELQKAEGREFSDHELSILIHTAEGNRKEDGEPDFAYALEALNGGYEARQKAYLDSKRAGGPLPGEAGAKPIDLKDDEARVQAVADAIAAANESP